MTNKLQSTPYKITTRLLSRCFTIIPNRPTIQYHRKTEYSTEAGQNGSPSASFKDNHTHHFHEVAYRVQRRYGPGPSGHAFYRGEIGRASSRVSALQDGNV